MADATDLFRKGKSNFATTLASGISDSDTTIPLSSAVGLPTDTAVTLTIDRVDANGKSTPDDVERVTGVVSGTNLVDCLRGEDGTTPSAHEAGAVVEMIWDGETWNDAVGGILAEHNQDGTHKDVSLGDSSDFLVEHNANGTHANVSLENSDDFKVEHNADGTHKINTFQHLYTPEGFLINGKIVPSVSSNNLTVAIKGMDGNDPSATNPVYARIGDAIRSITSALSVTANAGTNWFNAGSTELATKEIDYFVYLGYNTTDGVVIGFARIPYATAYSQFSTTTTNERYCAISNISHASSSDSYTVVGRFAATLSAGAGYTWGVPTFTSINLVQRPIYETRMLTSNANLTGFSSIVNGGLRYQIISNKLTFACSASGAFLGGTSNGTGFGFTLPVAPSLAYFSLASVFVKDKGVNLSTLGHLRVPTDWSAAVTAHKGFFETSWTNSGEKGVYLPEITCSI